MANLSDFVDFALAVTTRYEKESRVERSFLTAPAPSRFSPINLDHPASKSNIDKLKGWWSRRVSENQNHCCSRMAQVQHAHTSQRLELKSCQPPKVVNPTWPDLFSIKFGTKKRTQNNKLLYSQTISTSLHIYAKVMNNSAIIACIILFFFKFNGSPTPNLCKQSEASTCCYVTSHWQW